MGVDRFLGDRGDRVELDELRTNLFSIGAPRDTVTTGEFSDRLNAETGRLRADDRRRHVDDCALLLCYFVVELTFKKIAHWLKSGKFVVLGKIPAET
jgi:hypothetical protein